MLAARIATGLQLMQEKPVLAFKYLPTAGPGLPQIGWLSP